MQGQTWTRGLICTYHVGSQPDEREQCLDDASPCYARQSSRYWKIIKQFGRKRERARVKGSREIRRKAHLPCNLAAWTDGAQFSPSIMGSRTPICKAEYKTSCLRSTNPQACRCWIMAFVLQLLQHTRRSRRKTLSEASHERSPLFENG
jgi:hypothetical protein